jgi:phage gp36-like protein
MAYSTNDDLLNEYSESELAILTGDPTGQTINEDRIDYARSNADALIDAYLYGRFDVPFTGEINPIIKKISVDLTVNSLYEIAYSRTTVPSTITWRKINAVKMLKDMQQGIVSMTGSNPTVNAPPPIITNKEADDEIFDKELLDQFYGNGDV